MIIINVNNILLESYKKERENSSSSFIKSLNVISLFILLLSGNVIANTYTVSNPVPQAIKQTVQQSLPGDTIILKKAVYYETGIIIDKPLTIIGQDFPVIDANFKGEDIIIISSEGVNLLGFVFKNVPVSYVADNAAVKLKAVGNCKIENLRVINSFFGIYLANSHNCIISNNEIIGTGNKETASGNGIHLWHCRKIEILNNKVSSHRDGIYFEFVTSGLIKGNTSEKNVRYGLHFMFSDSCKYRSNIFMNNGAGVAVMYTHYVEMTNNQFIHNWGSSSYGLLLKDIAKSIIKYNNFHGNTVGIYAEGSDNIEIEHNNFVYNGWAVRVMGNCRDNIFTKNNFIGNTFDVATNSSFSYNTFKNNYWSKYRGYDLNKDGIGDVPYRPVTLFSLLVQKYDMTVILIHSL
ncbi:MAG: nitrous oxide reductase family maturation protein NosD, partial [FCB group bacterium]